MALKQTKSEKFPTKLPLQLFGKLASLMVYSSKTKHKITLI